MALPKNLDVHLFETRDGRWGVRIEGLPEGRTYVGGVTTPTPGEALDLASGYVQAAYNELPSDTESV